MFAVFVALLTYVLLRLFFFSGSSLNLRPFLVALTGMLTTVFALSALLAHGNQGFWIFLAFWFALNTYALLHVRKFRYRTFFRRQPPDDEGGPTALVPLVPKGPPPTLFAEVEWPVE